MQEIDQDHPIYSIGVVSDLLGIPTEAIRIWEKAGVIPPTHRRGGKRFYSQKEFKRLQFARGLSREGLSIRAMLFCNSILAGKPAIALDACTIRTKIAVPNLTGKWKALFVRSPIWKTRVQIV